MAFRFSTCLKNKILSGPAALRSSVIKTATTIAAVDGGAGLDSFTDSDNGFVAAGFSVGDAILVTGFAGSGVANNGKIFTIVSVTPGTIEVATGSLAAETATASVTLVTVAASTIKDIFKDGWIGIYSTTQPISADRAYTGSLLARITLASGEFVAGAPANGLEFGVASLGIITKDSGVWSGVGLVEAAAGWYRFYANSMDAGGADTTYIYPRIDGSIGTSGAQMISSNTLVQVGATITIDSYQITFGAEGT
jgi:hypothetical protein